MTAIQNQMSERERRDLVERLRRERDTHNHEYNRAIQALGGDPSGASTPQSGNGLLVDAIIDAIAQVVDALFVVGKELIIALIDFIKWSVKRLRR